MVTECHVGYQSSTPGELAGASREIGGITRVNRRAAVLVEGESLGRVERDDAAPKGSEEGGGGVRV